MTSSEVLFWLQSLSWLLSPTVNHLSVPLLGLSMGFLGTREALPELAWETACLGCPGHVIPDRDLAPSTPLARAHLMATASYALLTYLSGQITPVWTLPGKYRGSSARSSLKLELFGHNRVRPWPGRLLNHACRGSRMHREAACGSRPKVETRHDFDMPTKAMA